MTLEVQTGSRQRQRLRTAGSAAAGWRMRAGRRAGAGNRFCFDNELAARGAAVGTILVQNW
jgi:hypothetical protein